MVHKTLPEATLINRGVTAPNKYLSKLNMKLKNWGTAGVMMAIMLAACGGTAMFDVGGVIYTDEAPGIPNSGLVLTNGNDTLTIPAGSTTFTFPTRIPYGTSYDIKIKSPPTHMHCDRKYFTDSAGHTLNIQATIICHPNSYTLGGTVTGLAGNESIGSGLVLTNGSTGGIVSIPKPANGTGTTAFAFSRPVLDGRPYGVTVLEQPVGLFCTVSRGTDVMHESPVGDILVTCSPK